MPPPSPPKLQRVVGERRLFLLRTVATVLALCGIAIRFVTGPNNEEKNNSPRFLWHLTLPQTPGGIHKLKVAIHAPSQLIQQQEQRNPPPPSFASDGWTKSNKRPPSATYFDSSFPRRYPGPLDSAVLASKASLSSLMLEPNAWANDLFHNEFTKMESVKGQLRVREALHTLGQAHASRLSLPLSTPLALCNRTVVTLSTLPSRLPHLHKVIKALKAASMPPDAIVVGLPPFSIRLGTLYPPPPAYLTEDPLVKLVHLPVDYGPLSKLAAALEVEHDPDTCLILVDDDNTPWVEQFRVLRSWAALFPTAVVADSGWNTSCFTDRRIPYVCPSARDEYLFVRQDIDSMCNPVLQKAGELALYDCLSPVHAATVRPVDVVMGTSSPLFRRGFFGEDFLDLMKVLVARKIAGRLEEEEERLEKGEGGREGGGGSLDPTVRALMNATLQTHQTLALSNTTAIPDVLPEAVFNTDDVYISAYLACRGVPRLIVPSKYNAQVPGGLLPLENAPEWGPKPVDNGPQLDQIDPLHQSHGFNEKNGEAVRFFHFGMGCW